MIKDLLKIINVELNVLNIRFRGSAQFYVHKSLIKRHSKQVYIQLYEYLMNSPYQSFYTSRSFEYIWHIIFTGLIIDIE